MTDSTGSPVAAKPAAHYHNVAAAWLEAECLTRGIRLHEPFAQAICARIAEALMEGERAVAKLIDTVANARRLSLKLKAQRVELASLQQRATAMLAIMERERSWPLWRRLWMWLTLRRCA